MDHIIHFDAGRILEFALVSSQQTLRGKEERPVKRKRSTFNYLAIDNLDYVEVNELLKASSNKDLNSPHIEKLSNKEADTRNKIVLAERKIQIDSQLPVEPNQFLPSEEGGFIKSVSVDSENGNDQHAFTTDEIKISFSDVNDPLLSYL